jgi:hypothetical protein
MNKLRSWRGARLAVGTAYAEKGAIEKQQEKGGALNNDSSFRVLDKNNDGYLTKAEAAGNADLAKRFARPTPTRTASSAAWNTSR